MKVSEASDAELNRFIARMFEPEPMPRTRSSDPSETPGRMWSIHPFGVSWIPLDFTHTGDGLKMMMEHHQFVSVDHLDDCDEGEWGAIFCKSQTHSIMCEEFANSLAATLLRAVSQAFALANGWKG